jgi:hypothetical protein
MIAVPFSSPWTMHVRLGAVSVVSGNALESFSD